MLVREMQDSFGRDLPFLAKFVEATTRVAGGDYGALFVTEKGKPPRIAAVYPLPQNRKVHVEPGRLAFLKDCANRCREAGAIAVFRVGTGDEVSYAVCAPLFRGKAIEGVSIALTPAREDPDRPQRLAQLQIISALYAGHFARRKLNRHVRQATEHRIALQALGAVQRAERFDACAMALCNQLKPDLNAYRVSLGWVHGNTVRVRAMSETENIDRRQEMLQRIEAAMEECFDQHQPIVYPSKHLTGDDAWLTQAVARCHAEVVGEDRRSAVCSVPLRHQDRIVGVVTVERPVTRKFGGKAISHLQAGGDRRTPRLADRRLDDRPLVVKAARSVAAGVGKVIGPQHVGAKLAALLVMACVVYACIAKWDYRIEAPFRLEAGAKRVYSAPFAGILDQVFVEQGESVEAGQVLATFKHEDLELARAEVVAGMAEASALRHLAMEQKDSAEAARQQAVYKQYEARKRLLDYQIEHATLSATDTCVDLAGDWKERQGVRVEMGAEIFQVAPIHELRAVVAVDERDIDRVTPQSIGELATRTYPEQVFDVRVRRIVPLASPGVGGNVFEAYAELDRHAPWMRPGMEGTAKIDAGRERVIWIATHKLVDFLRMQLWM